ncbi:MAG: cation-translocating P-type ATPase [Ideonella sp.]
MASTPPLSAELAVLDDPVEQQQFTRWTEGDAGQTTAESSFLLTGMYCAACAGLIEAAVSRVAGVSEVQVNSAGQRARVRWDPRCTTPSALVLAVRAAGYDAVPDAAAPAREMRRKERKNALWRAFVASFCAMQVMMMATPSYVATGADLAPDLRQLLNWGSWLLALPVLLFAAGPFFRGAWASLRRGAISMDVPVALGVAVTFVASTGATFEPGGMFGNEVYFDSMTMFVSFLLLGRFVEMSARHRAAESLEKTLAGMPETAVRLLADGAEETVSAQRLRAGDRVRVAVGQAFPADGRLEAGQTQADEALLTGESRPVPKRCADELVAGSINLAAPVVMTVERVGTDTRHQAIVAMMRDALSQRPAMARWADAWAGPFLWAVLLLAAGGAAAWSMIDPSRAVWVAVSVLIVTCPCALSLATPSALVAAAGTLARNGVMLQRLDALEALAGMTRLCTDKTGTLTEDQPRWNHTEVLVQGQDVPALQAQAAALARWSSHPLSRSLSALTDEPLAEGAFWQQIDEQPGAGLQATDPGGRVWRLGSLHWVSRGEAAPSTIDDPSGVAAQGALQVFFGPQSGDCGEAWLRFDFDERLRPGAVAALRDLQADGVEVSLLSGDAPARVQRLAGELGLTELRGGASPRDKLDYLAAAQAQGQVVGMLGDGVNDAPVLARANVSFAMGQGALVSRLHADAVIVSDRLEALVLARRLAKRTMAIIRQNLLWAAVYNAACIPLALLGMLPPWAAGLGMASSSLLVVANSWRLSRTGSR